ncbi:tetratricopeptide repeat protein [Flavobacterium psychrophilum]|uniref:tetratricopeptide repeat protein n=1 Tax=Flavobacterium psychrophilum TaxID=96345 RepID=UPI00188733F5|nr:tetratricopeptide repeat protein [Flavobacterium psychrophilum]MBF1997449.1 tetratricopeptide repeat protein [Flavobacterium psychrophilum]MBF2082695.1 tetratricopeptide repeat protein [Flavobacterium psychrophilum]MCB6069591.1 tetratricopeptide repeat protein [Flavobacterium psychrophilum]MCB6091837.1 tetratricopeptide repeat protein [Flavobacterium psychrophilum]MCB6094296.1 tetratricopeptide repeat protein [Flavobacterium psychrophilum]
MQKYLLSLFVFLSFVFTSMFAQQSAIYTNDLAAYNKALSLFNDKQYQSAQILFDKVKQENSNPELEADCTYYSANCAIRLNQNNADEKMQNFVKNYPTSTKQNLAYTEVATYYFEQGKYPQALEWFDKVDESSLTEDELDKYNFYKGYSFFNSSKKKEATQYFNKVVNSQEYGSQAKYYLGFLAYEGDDYKEATKYFDQVSGEEKYKEKLSYFQADMNFKLGKFDKAIQLGQPAMNNSNDFEKSELNKIIGESYFNLKEYNQAIPFLKEYKGKKGKWNNTDYYQLGYAFYKQNDFENAINQFNKIIDGKDFVAQNAYYHLGESYLKTDKKPQALNAFKNASEMTFDIKIQEDAALNYARLSYDIGNSYQSVPDVLNGFMTKYPSNPNKPEIENLLINSYITSKNYKEALNLLEKNKSFENKTAYQKVAFYRGLELFTDGSYKEALAIFKKSIAEQKDPKFSARGTFWKAETEYILNDFTNALLSFKQFLGYPEAKETVEFANVNYNMAYSHFKLKEYEQAGNFFQKYIEVSKDDKTRLTDAYLRLADSKFVTTRYAAALEAYDKAIILKTFDADYAAFQKAICYGFMGKNDKKIAGFNQFLKTYPNSQYRDDALFELANTYTTENETASSIKTYDQLIAENSNGSYVSKALLRQGLIYYNADKDEQALTKFKKVVANFPKSEEALEAVKTARLIYVDNGKVDEYATWVKSLDFVNISDSDLDNDSWEAAEKQYLQGNNKQAITNLSSYIKTFPNGIRILKANFYLAESYFKEESANSIPYYEYTISKARSEYTEQSLSRLCQIFLRNTNYTKAIPVLLRLESEADFPQNKTYAQANLMKSYYTEKDYANSVIYAEKVLENPKTEDKIKSDAQIIVARSDIKVGNEAKAKVAYAKLQKIAKGELAAEALFYEAYFKNAASQFEESNKVVQKLAKDYSGYKYFGAKGLVVMAKNFYGLKDSFQATYILESVIKNFTDYADVVLEAKKELDLIKFEEAKTNSSITK